MSVFRKAYRPLSVEEQQAVDAVKDTAEALNSLYAAQHTTREMSIARTKLEESVMWATKSMTA